MGYIFLSVLTNAIKGFCSKSISAHVPTSAVNIRINLIRSFLCALIGAALVICTGGAAALKVSASEIGICALSGTAMAIFLLSWIFALRTDAYMLVSASGSASFVVPVILGVFLLGEKITYFKILALLCILAALFFLLRYNTHIKGKITKKQMLLLVMITLSQGINQAMQKVYAHYITKDVSVYNFYTFVFAFAAMLAAGFFVKGGKADTHAISKKVYIYIAVMSLALFGTSYFQSLAALSVDAIILYPITNALSLVAGSIMAFAFFKEKIKRDCIIGIVLTLIALIFSRL